MKIKQIEEIDLSVRGIKDRHFSMTNGFSELTGSAMFDIQEKLNEIITTLNLIIKK